MINESALLETPIEIAFIFQNNLGEDLEIYSNENSFHFLYKENDQKFGALIL